VLDWDSSFFGFRIAKIRESRLTGQALSDAFKWCSRQRISCLYFLASAACPKTTELAEDNGFRMVDQRITLSMKSKIETGSTEPKVEAALSGAVRRFVEQDLPSLRAIAAASHHDSRFYFDSGFPNQRCDELYETWIERSCHGYAEAVLVADHLGTPAGYVSCHLHPQGEGTIGLLAVSASSRGLGLGGQLIAGALQFFESAGCTNVSVTTQGRNWPAQRLYQNHGFRSAAVQIWYHRWFDRSHI
jgi:dTDP-4-amino-4,6-dideoxy-D-galactose acyltransferase